MTGGSQCTGSSWGWLKVTMRIALLSCPVGHGQDEQAASVVSWLGAWSDAQRWRCPPLDARRPVASVPIGRAATLDWDVRPTGRSAVPPCPSARQPLPGVRTRTDRRGRWPGGCPVSTPGRKPAARLPVGMSATPRRGPGGATERSRVGRTGRRKHAKRGWGQWVSASGSRSPAGGRQTSRQSPSGSDGSRREAFGAFAG